MLHQIALDGTDQTFPCAPDDTVLRAALRAGWAFPYECNVGSCGNCKFEWLDGALESCWPEAPGLSDKDRQRHRWLGCQTRPLGDARIKLRLGEKYRPLHRPLRTGAQLLAVRSITHDLSEFRFVLDQPMPFLSGQYALLQLPDVTGVRAYSMSTAGGSSAQLAFQVRRVPQGQGSTALFERLRPGDRVQLDGPYGMAYLREDAPRDLLCIAGGSGLAPMLSIARGAWASPRLAGRRLRFVYGARRAMDVCGEDMLQELAGWSERGSYHAAISGYEAGEHLPEGALSGFVHDAVDQLYGDTLALHEIYFAGPPAMAQALLKLLLARKLPMEQVHFDQFY
jgi:toluene monooxygenase electron transfer component